MPIKGLIFILAVAMVWLFVEALFMAAEDPYDNLTDDEFKQMIEDLRNDSTENASDSRKIHGL